MQTPIPAAMKREGRKEGKRGARHSNQCTRSASTGRGLPGSEEPS